MNRRDQWSETTDKTTLLSDHTTAFLDIHDKTDGKDKFHISQWLLTPKLDMWSSVGLATFAQWKANPMLYWGGVAAVTPTSFPNVIMQDYFGLLLLDHHDWQYLGSELKTLCIGLNLYMVSENCEISPGKHPLKKKKNLGCKAACSLERFHFCQRNCHR